MTTDAAPNTSDLPPAPAAHPPTTAPVGAGPVDGGTPPAEPETFPREYVARLRAENAEARVKAKRADALAEQVVRLTVTATGRLADARDLPVSPEMLTVDGAPDVEIITAAVDALLAERPHLAARRVSGDVGQGQRGVGGGTPSLGQVLMGTRKK